MNTLTAFSAEEKDPPKKETHKSELNPMVGLHYSQVHADPERLYMLESYLWVK